MGTTRFSVPPAVALLATVWICSGAFAADKPQLPASSAAQPRGPAAVTLLRNGPDLKLVKLWTARWNPDDPGFSNLQPLTEPVRVGQKLVFVCDLVNLGPAVTVLWGLGFYVDDVMVWNNSWGPLAVKAPLRGIGPYTPEAAGSHTLRCQLDYEDKLRDRDPKNNSASLTFTVLPKPKKVVPPDQRLPAR